MFNSLKFVAYNIIQRPVSRTSVCWLHQVQEIRLKEYGNVSDNKNILELRTSELDENRVDLKPGQILVRLIAASINPADLNIIQGRYAALPKQLPEVIGNEGVFEVLKSHETSKKQFKPGDWVIPVELSWGAWRSHAIEDEGIFCKIPNNISKEAAATIKVNPCTAHRMLVDFGELKPNDTVIQNGANSAVGQAVIQLGKIMNLNIINIVRKRATSEKQEALNNELKELGAKYIFTDEDLRTSPLLTKELWKQIPRPRLALNCVGGKATADMVRLLDKKSTVVTYGGMSKQPLTFNTADFIFKDLRARGFWLTAWRGSHEREYEQTLNYLSSLIQAGKFHAPKCELFKLQDYVHALERAQQAQTNKKVLFELK